jgi:hypothetical protein
LANLLKTLLHKFIGPTQSAFFKGRNPHDNTIMAHQIFHTMKLKKGRGELMVLQLNLEKAFDRMEWSYILTILSLLGFHSKWMDQI